MDHFSTVELQEFIAQAQRILSRLDDGLTEVYMSPDLPDLKNILLAGVEDDHLD